MSELFYRIPKSVIENNEISYDDVKVFFIIQNFLDSKEKLFLSIDNISKKLKISRMSALTSLHNLVRFGYLNVNNKEEIDSKDSVFSILTGEKQ